MAPFAIRAPSVDALLDPYSVEPLERRPLQEEVRDRVLRAWIDTRRERPSHLSVELPASERQGDLGSRLQAAIRNDLARTYEAQGKFADAIAMYEADTSPQRHGNRLRGKWLKSRPANSTTADGDAAE